ncbi:MAG: ATP-binding cassette domain-containing protein [Symbiobacteriaceae bacterium]|nr:ATP-binding cassette domain-containing protein [Symbiobacteriaceae bacterium]
MLEIGMNNVVRNFGFGNVLNGVNLEVTTGERVALVGRNGTGKSTILKIIYGEEIVTSGSVQVRRGATIGYLEQIPELLARETLTRELLMEPFAELQAIEERLRQLEAQMSASTAARDDKALERLMRSYAHQQELYESLDGYGIEERFGRVTTGFGLTELLDRPFNALSGGQKTIVMLACVMLRNPDILLLDEPTNHLDMQTLEWFEGYLARYKGTVIIVSHDRYFLDRVATKTILLYKGKCTAFMGNYSFSLKEQERLLMLEFEQYKNQQKKIEAMEAAIRRYRDWAARADNEDFYRRAKELEKRLEKMDKLERPELEKAQIPLSFTGNRSSKEVLKLQGVTLQIGEKLLLRQASLMLFFRDKGCLIGDNGSGKTTLLRAILGEIPSHGISIAENAKIGYVPQEIRFADDRTSVLDTFRGEVICTEGQARNILAKYFFFGEDVYKRVAALSGGEKVLLKLAVLMQHEINLLVLDEPTNHIDIETREMLENALLDFDGTILFVSHDRYFIQKIAQRIFAIGNLEIITYEGDYEEYRAYKNL